jgi:hypothetical protein
MIENKRSCHFCENAVNDEHKQNDMSEVAARYWKKQTELLVLPVQHIPRTNSIRARFVTRNSEVRIQSQSI